MPYFVLPKVQGTSYRLVVNRVHCQLNNVMLDNSQLYRCSCTACTGSIDNMAQQYNFDPRDPLPPHLTNGQAIPPPTPTTQTQDWEKPAALRSIATEGALEGVKQAKQLEQEAEQRRKEGGAAREAPAAATEGSPEPQTAGQLLEQLGMRGVDSSGWHCGAGRGGCRGPRCLLYGW
jgi:hypothetical protein